MGCDMEGWGICLVCGSVPHEWHSISLLTCLPGPGPMGHVLTRLPWECLQLLPQPLLFSLLDEDKFFQAHNCQGWVKQGTGRPRDPNIN